jgi:hypothetical protein
MNLNHLLAAAAALTLSAGAAYAQDPAPSEQPAAAPAPEAAPPAVVPGSSTTDVATSPSGVTTATTSAVAAGSNASVTVSLTTNGPVPDTAENRAKYGQPLSHAGKRTAAKGN